VSLWASSIWRLARRVVKLGKAFFSLFFIFSLFLSLASAYNVVHYDTFKYTANYSALISSHGFLNQYGATKCTASYGSEHYLLCGDAVQFLVSQKFNLVNSTFCISNTSTVSGGARNFSLRGNIRGSALFAPYTTSHTARFYSTYVNLTSDASYLFYTLNSSGSTIGEIHRTGTTTGLISEGLNYNWHPFQIDYYTRPNGANLEVYASNITILANNGTIVSNYGLLSTPRVFSCVNTTNLLIRGFYYIDYIEVITYGTEEPYIPLTEEIPDVYTLVNNRMPTFSFTTSDENFEQTSTVDYSHKLFLDFYNIGDLEGDDIYNSIDCGVKTSLPDLYYQIDNFTESLDTIKARYDMADTNNTLTSYSGKPGLRFNAEDNGTIFTWRFSQAYPNEYAYLYPNYNYFVENEIVLPSNNMLIYQFNSLNGNNPVIIGFLYNSTSGRTGIYTGNSCCIFAPTLLYSGVNISNSPMKLKIMFNKDDSTYSFALNQSNKEFYSSPLSFDWGSPLSSIQVYSYSTLFYPENKNFTIGELKLFTIDNLPGFGLFSANGSYYCNMSTGGTYRGYVFFTDNAHQDNYLNYKNLDWQVSVYGEVPIVLPDNAYNAAFEDVFLGSQALKYLFAMGILVTVTIACMYFGGMYGNVMAGAITSIFMDTIAIFILVILGVLPTWFAVVIFLLMALAIAYAISKFTGGGNVPEG
jgi:hypothetical protein